MEGSQKRAKPATGSEEGESCARKQLKTGDWCSDCWAAVKDACRESHHVTDMNAAETDVKAKFAAAHAETVRLQARLDLLAAARVRRGPTLVANVEEIDEEGWRVDGGDVRIQLAGGQSLTPKEKKAICKELGRASLEYIMKGTDCVMATASVGRALRPAVAGLQDCTKGQAVPKGAVLVDAAGRLEIHFRRTTFGGQRDKKLLGMVNEAGLKALQGRAYNEDTYVLPSELCDVKFLD